MGILDERDAVILAEVAQGEVLPVAEREDILRSASPQAQRIGRVLIGSTRGSAGERRIAESFRKWAESNADFVRRRRAARARAIAAAG